LLEFKKFNNREKYLISNNPEINGENFETLEKKILKEKSGSLNHNLSPMNRFDCINNDSNQTIIMMGDQTCSRKRSEYLPLKILESYLSYGMSAALFKLFREKHGITYDLGVYYPIRSGNSPFLIYLSVSNKRALFAFELLTTLWGNLLFNPLTDDEIFLAKEKLKGSFLLGNQSLDEILQRRVQLISYGISPISETDLNSKIDEISSIDILKITNKYFSKPFLSISGNEKICLEISKMWKKNF
jgi:predicted Zn-dependent peptidase